MAKFRVTYATLSADNEELHAAYEQGVATARSWLGQTFPAYVNGEARTDGPTFDLSSPNDRGLHLGTFHSATERDVKDAIAAARAAATASSTSRSLAWWKLPSTRRESLGLVRVKVGPSLRALPST